MNLKKTLNANSRKVYLIFLFVILAGAGTILLVAHLATSKTIPQSNVMQTRQHTVYYGEHRLYVELATDPQSREQGLMYRTEMASDAGMLFIFETPSVLSFWMKNTYIPLDIIFLDANLRVVAVHENTTPNQINETYASFVPAKYALETNAGWVQNSGLTEGDTLVIKIVR